MDGCYAREWPGGQSPDEQGRHAELKAAADALVEREAQVSSILRTAGMPIVCTDLETRIVAFNPAAEETFGVRREQVLGTGYADLFPPAVRPKVRADLQRIAAGGGISFENAITRPDGVRVVILWNMQAMVDRHGVARGVMAVGHDVTLRQRAEEALYGQLQLLRRLSAWLGDPATGLDDVRAEIDRAAAALRFHLDDRMLPVKPVDRLTRREREVFAQLARGLTNAEIARALDLSVRTIETHRSHLMAKLGLRGPRELIHYAVRCGIAPPQP
jgi:PAS domain S-box-containing protein